MLELSSITPLLIVLTSAVASLLIFATAKKPNSRESVTFIAAGIKLYLLGTMTPWIIQGNVYICHISSFIPGLPISFKIDALGLLFAYVAASLWILTTMYSIGYMRHLKEHAQTRYFACFAIALAATMGVSFSANLLTLYIFYEILSLSTYPLVAHHQDSDGRSGSRKYLTYLLGTSIAFILPAMIITYQLTGTLDFTGTGVFDASVPTTTLTVLLLLFIFGFAKGGLMPFHSWLPGAMVAPTPVSSLLHAVAVVKVGVFSIVRIITGIFGIQLLTTTHLNTLICVIAGFTVIAASLIALSQDNLKRLLAFSTVGQLSYIILGAGIANTLGVQGSILHIAMHAFGKITLFFCAGAIFAATGKKYISQMSGIGRQMPYTMIAFSIGALSIIGLPPAAGFISKWYMVLGAANSTNQWVLLIYLCSTLLNAAYFLPIIYKAFFSSNTNNEFNTGIKEAPLFCLMPLIITALLTLALFVYPQPFFDLSAQFVETLVSSNP
jgi:multicomponent Na+:H+ antiporter subunit D